MTRAERKKETEAKINKYKLIILDAMISWAKACSTVENRIPSLREVLMHGDMEIQRQYHKYPMEKQYILAAAGTVRRELLIKLLEVYGEEQQKES